jgi:hypothetical protein
MKHVRAFSVLRRSALRRAGIAGLILLLSTARGAQADECDFFAMLAPEGSQISDFSMESGHYQDFLQTHSNSLNNDGYGLIYYNNRSPFIEAESQGFYATGTPVYWGFNDIVNGERVMTTAFNAINDGTNQAVIALGHARNGTGGFGNHPFTFNWNGKTYSFQHNGVLLNEMKAALLARMQPGANGWIDYLNQSNSNYYGNWQGLRNTASSWIDSELLFYYLMFHIDEADGDVVTGLFQALNETNYYNLDVKNAFYSGSGSPDNTINFVLSDGQALYVYKNASESDNTHQIYWKVHASGLVGVQTTNGIGYNAVDQYELVMIPRKGSPARFTDVYSFEGGLVEARKYHTGSNWVCFPVLPTVFGLELDEFFANLSDIAITSSMSVEHETDIPAIWDGFRWELNGIESVESTKGYKLNILEGSYTIYNHLMAGAERIAPDTELFLHAGWNDVPYFLEQSQHPSEAFPQAVLDVMSSINGEYWFMIRRNGEFVVKRLCGPPVKGFECYTLQDGAMYQVHVTQSISFQWNQPPEPIDSYVPPELVHFQPEKLPDYIPVVIEDIEGDTGIAEIGVMQEGICVGAQVVDGYPINLQVYTDDLSTVQFVYADADGLLLPAGQGETVTGAGKRLAVQTYERTQSGAAVITLARGTGDADQPTDFRILSAHPNPFNPTTTIRILLPEAGVIRLDIYNLAGQRVATLVDGHLQAGVHELGWNGQVDDGTAAASGIYYGVLSHGSERSTVKLLLVK